MGEHLHNEIHWTICTTKRTWVWESLGKQIYMYHADSLISISVGKSIDVPYQAGLRRGSWLMYTLWLHFSLGTSENMSIICRNRSFQKRMLQRDISSSETSMISLLAVNSIGSQIFCVFLFCKIFSKEDSLWVAKVRHLASELNTLQV
jgi:hypothetical protein